MNQPSIIVRVAGAPVAAIPLTLAGAWLIFLWSQGHATVWLALIGCLVVVKTISSARQRRAYKAWRKQWESVGSFGKAAPRRPIRVWRWATVLASASFIGSLVFWPQAASRPEIQSVLMWLWLLSGIFLAVRIVVGIARLIMKRRGRNVERAERKASPVACMLGGTLDSPSREEAVRNLPEYAARVLNR